MSGPGWLTGLVTAVGTGPDVTITAAVGTTNGTASVHVANSPTSIIFDSNLFGVVNLASVGDVSSPADAAIVGDEASVTAQIEALFEAGATDLWAAPFPVGDDKSASRARTRELLKALAG